jgi:hypothetical protein
MDDETVPKGMDGEWEDGIQMAANWERKIVPTEQQQRRPNQQQPQKVLFFK